MELNDELNAIWLRQTVPVAPPEKQLLADAAAVKRRLFLKQGVGGVLLILTLVYLQVLLGPMHFRLVTTRIGIGLTNLALIVYLAASGDLIFLWLRKEKQDGSVKECLAEMVLFRRRQEFLYGRLLGIYFILLFSGLMLYLLEFALKMRLAYGIGMYGLTIGWVLFAWLYLRPRTIKKYKEPVDRVIREMERIAGQFDGNS